MNVKDKEARVFPAEKRKAVQPVSNREWISVRVTRRSYILLCTFVLLPCFLATGYLLGRTHLPAKWKTGPPPVNATAQRLVLNPGPWGTLESVPFFIEIPEEYLTVRQDQQSDRRWFFKGSSREQAMAFLSGTGLNNREKEQMNSAKWESTATGVYVAAPQEVIFSMVPDVRSKIYYALAQFSENAWQREDAFAFPSESFEEFFANTPVPAETIAELKKLCWPRGSMLMFSDLPALLDTLASPKDKLRLEKALTRRPTMLLKLRVNSSSDINGLMRYWARAGTERDLRPLLEGLSKLPESVMVDVMHLLPPTPSARIYTYPFPSYQQPENCHWTTFNFFRDPPDSRYTDVNYVRQKVETDYYPVFSDPRYGDVIFLTKPNGEIIHSAVYVADDIAYTKNGGHFSAPWLLMRLSNLKDTYSTFVGPNEQVKVSYYRNKYY